MLGATLALLASCTSRHPSAGPSSSPKGGTEPKITSITAEPVNANQVDIYWIATGEGPYGYTVSRNGKYLGLVSSTSYVDPLVRPRKTYAYTVTPEDSKGNFFAEAHAVVTMPSPPPLSQARLAGSFDVRTVFTSENYTNRKVGDRFRERWKFEPRCADGACRVIVIMDRRGERHPVLARAGASYSGKGSDTIFTCNKVPIRETITISLHVTKGYFFRGTWTATAFSGTESRYGPPALGCIAGIAKLSLTATRRPLVPRSPIG